LADGNGRIARIMMNAELVAAKEQRIIIPTIYRPHYLSALKSIFNRASAEPLVRMLDFAQRFSQSMDWAGFPLAETELKAANTFIERAEADQRGLRLRIRQCA
jgi:hypothetical protein